MEQVNVCLDDVRSKGWTPVSAVVSQHGRETYCVHVYVMRQAKEEWQYGVFRYSTNQNVLKDTARVFASVDEGRVDFRQLLTFLYPVPHVVLKKEEIA